MLDDADRLKEATAAANACPLGKIDVSKPERFRDQTHWPWFDRLRREAPVHYCADSDFGPFWSVTTWDAVLEADKNHRQLSSELGGIFIGDPPPEAPRLKSFINADEPNHSLWRKPVMPGVGGDRVAQLEARAAERVGGILDELPIGEEFDWVDRVSIELTTQMLATLFDFPWEERRTLTRWSDAVTSTPRLGNNRLTEDERNAQLQEMYMGLSQLIRERRKKEPKFDFLSLMAHHPDLEGCEDDASFVMGQCALLIVGGNDTTRNSISGGLHALNQFPGEYDKLTANPDLIPNMVKEIVRWQTPLAHMRRTAIEDAKIGDQTIRAGDKVIMWYISANRDEAKFDNPYEFRIDRDNARNHTAFGYGIHRCMGNHVAEMQLRILWQEIVKRFSRIEVVGEPERTLSNFVMGFEKLPVVVHR